MVAAPSPDAELANFFKIGGAWLGKMCICEEGKPNTNGKRDSHPRMLLGQLRLLVNACFGKMRLPISLLHKDTNLSNIRTTASHSYLGRFDTVLEFGKGIEQAYNATARAQHSLIA